MRPPRISFVGGVYHVNVRCNNREFNFKDDEDFALYLRILLDVKLKYRVKIYAYILTHNHVHLLVGTPDKDNLSNFMRDLNGRFARAYNKKHGRTGHFWGERFFSTVIETATHFFNAVAYIELNMLRNKAVDRPEKWRWSSYRAHACGYDDPVLDFHQMYLDLGKTPQERQQAYREMVDNRIAESSLQKDPALSAGVITGSIAFVQDLVKKFGEKIPYYRGRKIYSWGGQFSLKRNKFPV